MMELSDGERIPVIYFAVLDTISNYGRQMDEQAGIRMFNTLTGCY